MFEIVERFEQIVDQNRSTIDLEKATRIIGEVSRFDETGKGSPEEICQNLFDTYLTECKAEYLELSDQQDLNTDYIDHIESNFVIKCAVLETQLASYSLSSFYEWIELNKWIKKQSIEIPMVIEFNSTIKQLVDLLGADQLSIKTSVERILPSLWTTSELKQIQSNLLDLTSE